MHRRIARHLGGRTGRPTLMLTVLMLVTIGSYGCGDNDRRDKNPLAQAMNSLQLMLEATERAQAQHADALLIQVVALPGPDGLVDADDTVLWDFDFMINDFSDGLVIRYENGTWSGPSVTPPFLGVVFADLNRVTLDLAAALGRLREEGYEEAYNEWNLFQPLVPGDPPPFYYFFGGTEPYPGVILRVDAFTGAVEYDAPFGIDRGPSAVSVTKCLGVTQGWFLECLGSCSGEDSDCLAQCSSDRNARDDSCLEGLNTRNSYGDCLDECRTSYLACADDCADNQPGNPSCYDTCNTERDQCDSLCYELYEEPGGVTPEDVQLTACTAVARGQFLQCNGTCGEGSETCVNGCTDARAQRDDACFGVYPSGSSGSDYGRCLAACRNEYLSCNDLCRAEYPGNPECTQVCDEERADCDLWCYEQFG